MDERMVSKCRRLVELRDANAEAQAAAKQTKQDLDAYEAELFYELEQSKFKPPYKVDLGPPHGIIRFSLRETNYARVLDPDQAMEYLEKRQLVDEATKAEFVKRRLNAIVRDALEHNEELPDGIDYYTDRGITVTKLK